MIYTLDNAVAFFRRDRDAEDLRIQFRNRILKQEPCVQRVFNASNRLANMPYSWNLYLAVQNAPTAFHFLELGAKDGTWVAQVEYFAQLWNKHPILTAVSESLTNSEHYKSAFDALDVSMCRTAFMDSYEWPILTDILLIHTGRHIRSFLSHLKLNGILILHSDLWLNKHLEGFEHLFEVGDYQVLRKVG